MTIVALIALAALPFTVASFATFTSLVKWEYTHHHTEWVGDGRPTGWLWYPLEWASYPQYRWGSGDATSVPRGSKRG